MSKLEERFVEFLKKHYVVIFVIAITLVGAMMRYSGRNFKSADWHVFFSVWYDSILKNGQMASMQYPIGDYNVFFQFLVAIFTYIPKDPLYLFKVLAICFDFSLAVACGACVYEFTKKDKRLSVLAYSLVWVSPFVVFNSTYWVQTDSIYTSFIMWALFFLLKKKNVPAFVMLGCALAFKVQVLFVLPFLVFVYVLNKSFSALHLLITVFVGWLSSIPAILHGRGLFVFFEVYGGQQAELHDMTVHYPNLWMILRGSYEHTEGFAIFLTTAVLGIGMYLLLSKGVRLDTGEKMLNTLIWTVWTVVMIMPGMHDRYGYLLETILLVASVYNIKKYGLYLLGAYLPTMMAYTRYLFEVDHNLAFWSVLSLVTYVAFTYRIFVKVIWSQNEECVAVR